MGRHSRKQIGTKKKKKKKSDSTKINDTPEHRDFVLEQNTFLDNFTDNFRKMDIKTKKMLLISVAAFAAVLVIVLAVILWPKASGGNNTQKQAATVDITKPNDIVDAYNKGNYKGVIPGLERYMGTNKDDLKMRELLASSYFLTGDNKKALNEYREILKAKNEDPETLYKIGIVLEQTGRDKEGIEYLSRAVHASPNTLLFHTELARASVKGKYYANAIEEWKNVLKLLPASDKARANVLAEIANIYIVQNDYTQAKGIIATGLAIDPDNQTLKALEAKTGGQIQSSPAKR